MTKEWISVYPEGYDLKTPQRKELYKMIFDELRDSFGDAPKKFPRALKVLFFEGKVETYSPTILDERELSGTRYNDLGPTPCVFICLASPVVSVEFYNEVLGNYQAGSLRGATAGIFDIRTARTHWSGDLVNRMSVLLQALDESLSKEGGVGIGKLLLFFLNLFAMLNSRGTSKLAMCKRVAQRFYQGFDDIQFDPARANKVATLAQRIMVLLNGEADNRDAYTDDWFVDFIRRYFSRDFSPSFLQFLDKLYESLPEEQRIGWDGQKITNYPGCA